MRPPQALAATSLIVATTLVLGAGGADGQSARPELDRASLELLLDRTAYAAGDQARLAARVTIAPDWHVQAHVPSLEYLIPTELELELPSGFGQGETRYPEGKMWQAGFADQPLAVYEGTVAIFTDVTVGAAKTERVTLRGRLRYQACDDQICLPPRTATAEVELRLADDGVAINDTVFAVAATDAPAERPGGSLALILLLAVVGGLILNAMPCVLPILSLKVFALVRAAGHGRREVTIGALATAAGILLSFWALAGAAIAARAAGQYVGWGVQFQNPGFVAFLTVVVVLFALNMWGLFEIPLPQRVARLGGSEQHGLVGHLWSGLFATLMATPCSAPYLGSAVGFALAQPTGIIVAVFTAIGVGMALPYLALAVAPRFASALPSPGAWMEHLRGFMGFLLAGTAIWLLFVLGAQVGSVRLAFLELGLLAMGLFAWLWRRLGASPLLRRVSVAGLLLSSVAVLVLAARAEVSGTPADPTVAGGRLDWTTWDRSRAEALAAEGRLVFVDVTADWCATCKFNERLVLETAEVAALFAQHRVVAMRADWTNRNDEIGAFLAEHGRYGIPFYLLYRPGAEPHVFGELLTKGRVIAAVEAASRVAVAAELNVPAAVLPGE